MIGAIADDFTGDAGLLPYLALGGGVLGFVRLDVPLGHGPQQAPAAIQAADEGHIDGGKIHRTVRLHSLREARKDQASGGCFDAGGQVRVFVEVGQ